MYMGTRRTKSFRSDEESDQSRSAISLSRLQQKVRYSHGRQQPISIRRSHFPRWKANRVLPYSRKLKPEQTRYTTTERELLSIVETLKEYRNILLGHQIKVHTDHKNLTCKQFNTDRVLQWRLILEEYGPELKYIQGTKNIVANLLSRLDISDSKVSATTHEDVNCMSEMFALEPNEIPFPHDTYPLSYAILQQEQQKDKNLAQMLEAKPEHYRHKSYAVGRHSYQLIVTSEDRIVIPQTLHRCVVQWYHDQLLHPGETRTESSIGQHYNWKKGMRRTIQ